jgi:hypothetical protein
MYGVSPFSLLTRIVILNNVSICDQTRHSSGVHRYRYSSCHREHMQDSCWSLTCTQNQCVPEFMGPTPAPEQGVPLEPILKSLPPYRLMCPQALPVRFWWYRSHPVSWPFPSRRGANNGKASRSRVPFSTLANHFHSAASFLRGLQQEGTP